MAHFRLPALLVVLFLLLPLAVACGTSDPAPAASAVRDITVTVSGRQVSPPPGRTEVTRGQTVRITVTSDVADVAHVHGYDKAADLRPGVPATIEFVAGTDGLFEVETHGSGLQLLQLVVR